MTQAPTVARKPSEILRVARGLISEPEHWSRGWYAFDADGVQCGYSHKRAVCFCSLGAIHRVSRSYVDFELANEHLIIAVGGNVADFNDSSTHPEVLAAFDKAIILAEQSEAQP